jgi:hypothetical protein
MIRRLKKFLSYLAQYTTIGLLGGFPLAVLTVTVLSRYSTLSLDERILVGWGVWAICAIIGAIVGAILYRQDRQFTM